MFVREDVGGCIILKWVLGRKDAVVWTGLIWLRVWTSGWLFEHSNEPLGSIKCWELLEKLYN
jgi:hypothetical protein